MATKNAVSKKVVQDIELPLEITQRTGQYVVTLTSSGNPDHGQDPYRPLNGLKGKAEIAQTMEEAASKCQSFIRENNLGSGNWSGGDILESGRLVARVSYNGRIWNADPDYVPGATQVPSGFAAGRAPAENLPRIVFNDQHGTHIIFDVPVSRQNFEEACQAAIDIAKDLCAKQLTVGVNFYALGVDVQVVESSTVEIQHALWARSVDHRAAHTPFLHSKDGAAVVSDNESGANMSRTWTGVCCDGNDAKRYWYIGSSFGERSLHLLKARDYIAACMEAEPLRNIELVEVGPLPSGWQPEQISSVKDVAPGKPALSTEQIDHIMRLASLVALRRAKDTAALTGQGATNGTGRAQRELRSYLEGLALEAAPTVQQAEAKPADVTPLDLDKLASVIDCARAHVDDIAEGLGDGTYDPKENTDFPEKEEALAHVDAWHRSATQVQQKDVVAASVSTPVQAAPSNRFEPAIDVLANSHVQGSDLQSLRQQAASKIYMDYDLGDGISAVDASGWERVTPGDEWSRVVFVETEAVTNGEADLVPTTLRMVVRFESGSHHVRDAYARDDKGCDWGIPSITPGAQLKPAAAGAGLHATSARKEPAKQVANDGPSI